MEEFYKLTITRNNKEEEMYYGYLSYDQIICDVDILYEDGADAVEMEMITEKEFEKELAYWQIHKIVYNV